MRGRDSNRINMISTTIHFCEKNVSITAGISAFATVLANIKAKKQKITELSEKDVPFSKGVTEDLKSIRFRMTALALKCASATAAYGYSVNDNDIVAKVYFTEDDLNTMNKQNVATTCQNIHDTALTHIAQIVNWGATNTDVTNLNALIADYRKNSPNPRSAIISRADANRQIKILVRDILDNLLTNQLDHMVNTLKIQNLAFWSEYQMARNIIDLGIVHSKLKGVVVNANGTPLVNAWVRVYEPGTKKLLRETTTIGDGVYAISPMPVGYCDLVWELEGYVSKVESNMHIGAGKIVKRKVVLKK